MSALCLPRTRNAAGCCSPSAGSRARCRGWSAAAPATATCSRCASHRRARGCSSPTPTTCKQVFTGDPEVLHAGEANIVLLPVLGPNSVLLLDDAEHMAQRS